MSFKKEEKRLLRHLLQREIKHLKKDTKNILFEEDVRAAAGAAKARMFMRNLMKKLR